MIRSPFSRLSLLGGALLLGGCATVAPEPSVAPVTNTPPPAVQFLYGSGEAGALSIQAYHAMRDYVLEKARNRPRDSVVLSPDSRPARWNWVPCGDKPAAVVLDVDETALLNVGYEYHQAVAGSGYDAGAWDRWERTGADKVLPVPGAITALKALRSAGVTVIFNSNRKAANARHTEQAIEGALLGPVKHGETLFLAGDDAMGSAKDGRRQLIASRYCVLAMAGDQLGDFSDLFNSANPNVAGRRAEAVTGNFANKWGNGWFMLPNPVYGSGLRGSFDDVFRSDKRWTDPGPGK